MERRGQERDVGIPNSMGYTPPQMIQESPVKLPLAPILSTPPDRRANAMVSTRRGSSIFSPTQTLDHHYNPPPPPQQHRQLSPPPPPPQQQQPVVQKDHSPDPDPPPTTTPTTGGASNSKKPTQPQAPPPVQGSAPSAAGNIRYRECLKNHAAAMGGHVVDGCGEFMPSGEEGTPESLRCAACDCHRNFHRKEVDGEQSHYYTYNPNTGNKNSHRNPILHGQTPSSAPPHHKHSLSYSQGFTTGPTPPTMVNFGGNSGGAAAESSSEDLNMFQSGSGVHATGQTSFSGSKKRFRTKFSQEQKDRMHEFATKLGWRIQKQDEKEVQEFCSEVGVKRQVFKVWMHNNKQAMKKRQI
ncbi:zinc-finger homeodomain protein 6 [Sesamum indicum]|uniref:Zinc-finger homeodomain protein 6 n=1 Tax=Sesamum indicum TaxID=4182 RepID=A0A6I9UHD3_SESIN|nr:zinc-finger homeodomain protein 6 [Sesamum indicum]